MNPPVTASTRVEAVGAPVDLLGLAEALTGPAALVSVRGWRILVGEPLEVADDLTTLSRLADTLDWRGTPAEGPPFAGGLVGHLTDDLAPDLLALDPAWRARPAAVPLPALRFGLHDTAVCEDPNGATWLVAVNLPGRSRRPARERLAALRARVAAAPARIPTQPPAAGVATPSLDRAAHRAATARILEWIAAGDLYQLNLTLQLAAPWPLDGPALARRLWDASPGAAHAAWLRTAEGVQIVSASPETFLRTDGERVATRPIKGTRPRLADPVDDRAQADALLVAGKDRAEHVMIVDLERNDLGRVCVPGSVRVAELATLEAHPTVWHLTSTVRGHLREEVGLGDLVAATFPCGSVTGAPKRMAVARTALVEPVRRGVYCGAIGMVAPGLVELSVAIRTAVLHDGVARYGTGGGIVADSDPDAEWDEAMDKAAAFFTAVDARPPA